MHNVYRPRADHFQVCCPCHGGCAWEVFGPAGFLESWSASPRTVATRSSGRAEPQLPARHRASHHAGRTGGEPDAGSIYGVELDKEGDDMSPSCIFHWDWLDKNYIWPLSILISSSRLDSVSRMVTPSCSRGMSPTLDVILSLWLLS